MDMGRRTIILARHGEYDLTIDFPDNPDGHLTDTGRAQSEALAERLQSIQFAAIYSSPLLRARETAERIAARHLSVPFTIDEALQECIPSVPPRFEQLFAEIPANFIASGPAQAAGVFATYFAPLAEEEPNRTELIVTHGNLLGYLLCRVFDAPVDSWLRSDFGNCCISGILVRADGMLKLLYHNDGAHLPKLPLR